MTEKLHKFQEKMKITYEDFIRTQYAEMVQLARFIETELGREKAFDLIKKARDKLSIDPIEMGKADNVPITNFEEFKTMWKKGWSTMLPNHLTFTIKDDSPEKLEFNVTECIFTKVFKDMNATDLGYALMCHGDFAIAKAYHPKGRMIRTKTLMQGDSYCNHTYIWKEE